MQIDEQRDRLGVAGAVGNAVLDDGRLAEVLDQRQPVLDAVGDQLRGRIAEAPQPSGHGDVSADVGGKLGDRRIGLAVAHDRSVRPRRRYHQDGFRPVGLRQAFVGADRGVALQELAPRLAPASTVQDRADAERASQPLDHSSEAAQLQDAEVGAARGVELNIHLEPVRGKRRGDRAAGHSTMAMAPAIASSQPMFSSSSGPRRR